MYCVRCGVVLTDENMDAKARLPYRLEMCARCCKRFVRRVFSFYILLSSVIFCSIFYLYGSWL